MGIEGHIDRLFDERLRNVRDHILTMGKDVDAQIGAAVDLLLREDGDDTVVHAGHSAITQTELEIDGACLVTLATRAPVASDLRFVMTAMKVAMELGRVGDLAKAIGERSFGVGVHMNETDRQEIREMATLVRAMLDQMLLAFTSGDVQRAAQVVGREVDVNSAYARVFDRTLAAMARNNESVHVGVLVQGAVKRLERMADHISRAAQAVLARSRSLT